MEPKLKSELKNLKKCVYRYLGGSRTAATSKVELFVIIVNGCKPLTIITKCSTLDIAAALDPPSYFKVVYSFYLMVI